MQSTIFILITIFVALLGTSVVFADVWCPPDTCRIFSDPFGLDESDNNDFECYSTANNGITDGITTTDNMVDGVTEVPNGWTNDTELCTSNEYSECTTAADCQLLIAPGCSCYVSSCIHPYIACEGDGCNSGLSGCTGNECGGYQAECSFAYGSGGTCLIVNTAEVDYEESNSTTPTSTSSAPNACDEQQPTSSGSVAWKNPMWFVGVAVVISII